MSTTTIKRKALRNRVKARNRKSAIKRLSTKPTLKNIDIEEIKASFTKKTTKKETPKAEEVITEKTVKQEKQVVDTKSSTITETNLEKKEAKVDKAEAIEEKVEVKEEKAEAKEDKTKEDKSESVKGSEKKTTKATKKPVAKKAQE